MGRATRAPACPPRTWYFAEGATGAFFDLFFLIANPNDQPATVAARHLTPDGTVVTRTYAVAPTSRLTVWVDQEGPALADTAVATTFTATTDVPVVIERAMWWGDGTGWVEGHNSAGATTTGQTWGLAEGEVGGPRGVETYLLIGNPADRAGTARVTLTFEDGSQAVREVALPPTSRTNVAVGAAFPEAADRRFGAVVASVGATPVPLIVERAMYHDAGGVPWAAGTSAMGTVLRADGAGPTDATAAPLLPAVSGPIRLPGPVTPVLDAAHAATTTVGPAGGTVVTTASDGATYTLTVPRGALRTPTAITLTPVTALTGLPAPVDLVAAVHGAPDGLTFALPAKLTITLPQPSTGVLLGLVIPDAGATLDLTPVAHASATTLTVPVAHFSTIAIPRATAGLLAALGRLDQASAALSEADAMATSRQDIRGLLLGTRAELHARAGRLDEALAASAALLHEYEDQRARAAPVDGLKAGFDNVRQWAWAQRVRLLSEAGRHSEALEATEGARARAFADLLAARRLGAAGSRAPAGPGDVHGASPGSTPAPAPGPRPAMRGRAFDVLQVPSPVTAAVPHLAEIAAHAARLGSTVLSYWVERDAVRIWAVDGEARVRQAVVRTDARRLAQLVRATWSRDDARARAVTTRGGARALPGNATRALRELHELLITPIAHALPRTGARRLTIVPHGTLFRLSFAGLRSSSGRYLLEDFEIHYTPSLGVLGATEATARHAATSGALVVAAPVLGKALSSEGLEPLPGAAAEGTAVAALAAPPAAAVLIGPRATESEVRRLAGGRRVLHFASHAVVSDDHPLDSFLALASGAAGGDADGRFTAEEVYELRLDADLVVLSACRTAGGRVTGDGISGLARAFVYAGTPSVVATLWDLPDVAGAFALPRFYRERTRGGTKAAALRSAQLALLRALRGGRITVDSPAGRFALPEHPTFWAGLVLVGEP